MGAGGSSSAASTSTPMGATPGTAAPQSMIDAVGAAKGGPANSSYDWRWHRDHPDGGGGSPPGTPPPVSPPVAPINAGRRGRDFWNYDGSGVDYSGMDGSVRFDAQPQQGINDPSLLMKLMALLHLSQVVPSSPKPAAPPPTPTPVPTPSAEEKREGQKGMDLNKITQRADEMIDHDAQPYPDESSPMPDGVKVSKAEHIRAPAPPHIPHQSNPTGSMLSGLGSATHRGQMAAVRAGRKGSVYDGVSYDSGGSASPFPTGAQTAGAPMYPWYMPYGGQFTAPMSGAQNQGLAGAQRFAGSNPYGAAQSYNNTLLSGGFMGSADPYLQQIRQGMQGTKNQQDADAQQQIASAMAAGGNALSGARLAANARYMDQSNNNFNTTMGNLDYGNLAREEALRNQGVQQAMGLNSGEMGMYGNLMGMGAVPQQLEQHELNSQYGDWVRQIQAMQQGDQQNTNNALALLRTNPGGHQPQYGTSQAAGWAGLLSGLFGGGNGGGLFGGGQNGQGGLGGLLSQLFGGGGSQQYGDPSAAPGQNGYPETGGGSYWANGFDPSMLGGNGDFGDQNMQNPYGGEGWGDPYGGYGDPFGGEGWSDETFGNWGGWAYDPSNSYT